MKDLLSKIQYLKDRLYTGEKVESDDLKIVLEFIEEIIFFMLEKKVAKNEPKTLAEVLDLDSEEAEKEFKQFMKNLAEIEGENVK